VRHSDYEIRVFKIDITIFATYFALELIFFSWSVKDEWQVPESEY